jgi:hypothetical protein
MALHLSSERMDGEQRIDALEIRTGGKEHGVAPARRVGAAGGQQRAQEKPGSGRKHREFYPPDAYIASCFERSSDARSPALP